MYAFLGRHIMSTLAAAYFTVTLGVTIVSYRWKISVHGAGVGGPGAALIYVYGAVAIFVAIIWILVIWARTTLKQHSLEQSVGGVLLAIIISWTTYFFLFLP
jgi:membrane-associated phospholipid phosphatase